MGNALEEVGIFLSLGDMCMFVIDVEELGVTLNIVMRNAIGVVEVEGIRMGRNARVVMGKEKQNATAVMALGRKGRGMINVHIVVGLENQDV